MAKPRTLPLFRPLILSLILWAAASSAIAQVQFDHAEKRHLPRNVTYTSACVLGDVDGDGDLDLVTDSDQVTHLGLNDGRGVFVDATAQLPARNETFDAGDMALSDVDGDGDLDLLVQRRQTHVEIFHNDGTGRFTQVSSLPAPSTSESSMVVGDVDGDGDPDVVVGHRYNQNRLYLNDGAGGFVDSTAGRMPPNTVITDGMAMGDFDGDGDLDLVIGNSGNLGKQSRLYFNNGAGYFTDVTSSHMPSKTANTNHVTVGDVDLDGDLDLFLGNSGSLPQPDWLYLNNGAGFFTDATAQRLPPLVGHTNGSVLADVDGDGDLDLVAGHGSLFIPAISTVYVNDGTGRFTEATPTLLPQQQPEASGCVAAGDVDGDGDPDLVIGGERDRLYLNTGGGVFADASVVRVALLPGLPGIKDSSLGDVDGDGDLDLVLAVYRGQNLLMLNDGNGHFVDATSQLPVETADSWSTALGDVDGDRDLDLVVGNTGVNSNWLLLNDGAGTFTQAGSSQLPPGNGASCELIDLDRDGDLDLLTSNQLCLNDGAGTFIDVTATHMSSVVRTSSFAVGDVDGDGDLDLVTAHYRQNANLYRNDGTAVFGPPIPLSIPTTDYPRVVMGDVDGDGDLDLVFTINEFGAPRAAALLLNDGTGVFVDVSSSALPLSSEGMSDVAMLDMDGDRDLDLLLWGTAYRNRNKRLYENDGTGSFTDVTATRLPARQPYLNLIAPGDVDGDGDTDFITAVTDEQPLVWINLTQQLHSPFMVVSGRTYQLDVYSRHALGTPNDVAIPLLSTGTSRVALPGLGVFGLDPARTVVLPAIAVSYPAGVATVTLTVPVIPAATSVPIHAQALLARVVAPWRLTAVASDAIIR